MICNTLRNKPEELIRYLLDGTSSKTGREFFRALVHSTAMAMDVAAVWITDYLPDRNIEDYEYNLAGTPCALVIERGCLVYFPDRIIELFPDDADLPRLNAVSYTGVPLFKPDGTVLGHLSARDTKPFELTPELESVFRIFADRAAAEFNRL